MITIPGRIPIRIYPLFWLMIGLIGWMNSQSISGTVTWAIVIFISIVIHEYGHALTARAFGQNAEINLIGLGGLTKHNGKSLKFWQEFLVILNGPLAGLALFAIAYKLQYMLNLDRFPVLGNALTIAIYVNLFWTLLNLIPILPLDGGHLMRVVLEGFFGFKGLKFSLLISIILSGVGSLLFFSTQSFFAGSILLMFGFETYQTWAGLKNIHSQDTSVPLNELLKEAQDELVAGNENEALAKFSQLRDQAKEGLLFVSVTQHIARILAHQGHLKQAYELLLPLQKKLSSDYLRFLQQLAYRLQEWEHAIEIGTRAYRSHPAPQTALTNALASAVLGQSKPAVGWVRCAIELGFSNSSEVLQKAEFDSIRQTTDFQALLRSLQSQ